MGQDREQSRAQRKAVRAKQSNNEKIICHKTCPTGAREQSAQAIHHHFGPLVDQDNTGHGPSAICDGRPLQG
jgi:hypothetical protein